MFGTISHSDSGRLLIDKIEITLTGDPGSPLRPFLPGGPVSPFGPDAPGAPAGPVAPVGPW